MIRILIATVLALGAAGAAAQQTVNMPIVIELSGAGAVSGTNFRDGAVLAIEEINAKGGILKRKINAQQSDTQSNPGVSRAQAEAQQRVLNLLHFGLREGGALFLGTSETIGGTDELYEPIDKKARIFRRIGPTRHGSIDFPLPRSFRPPVVGEPAKAGEGGNGGQVVERARAARQSMATMTHRTLLAHHTPAAVTVDRDHRILYGGYDAIYHAGARIRERYEHRPESFAKLASHFFTTYPQLEGLRFSHRWAGAIDTCTRFCAFWATSHRGRVAHTAGFTGLGVGATRFAADVLLDLLDGVATERTRLEMVRRKPLPFPPEPLASVGINLTRWSLDRADHRAGHRNLWLRTLDRFGLGFDS